MQEHEQIPRIPPSWDVLPATVLIVDDNRENLRLLSNILSRQGYTVRAALHGERALASAQTSPPDIILLDIMMPDMNGYEVCKLLKADTRTKHIPVIFISALNEAFDKVKAFTIGAVDYVTKPFQMEEILIRIETRLMIQRTSQALQQSNDQLVRTIDQLDRRNLEMSLLNRLSTALQSSETFTSAVNRSIPFLEQLFAETSGALYLSNTSSGMLDCIASWGQTLPADTESIPIEVCATLTYHPSTHDPSICSVATTVTPMSWVDHPLKSKGELLGLLRLQQPSTRDKPFLDHWWRLSVMVTDHIALALANLHLRERLHRQSIRDALTGLYNRRYLDETLPGEIRQACEDAYSIGVILLDIDHFKRFNDTHGHDGGDALLRAVGSLLTAQSRSKDIACRYGGEEFVLILPGATLDQTRIRAEQFRSYIEQLHVWHNSTMLDRISASFGVAAYNTHGTTDEEIIKAADRALYQAKREGRNRVIVAEQEG